MVNGFLLMILLCWGFVNGLNKFIYKYINYNQIVGLVY